MVLTGLFHVAIKTNDLEATIRFYTQIMGMRQVPRPNFGFPGAWLACPTPENPAIFHIYAGGPALGSTGVAPRETGAIDHVSLQAVGFHEFKRRITRLGLSCREFVVPGTHLWQLFVYDPNGVLLELTFDGQAEADPSPDLSPGRAYVAGDPFFNPKEYQVLSKSLHENPV